MYWTAVLLMAWSLATVTAILDSQKSEHYWENNKPDEAARYHNDNLLKTYVLRGGNKHFVTSVFPEMDAKGFHEYVFEGLQPDFQWPSTKFKRNYYTQGITSRGFSDDIFHQSFGMFEPLKSLSMIYIEQDLSNELTNEQILEKFAISNRPLQL